MASLAEWAAAVVVADLSGPIGVVARPTAAQVAGVRLSAPPPDARASVWRAAPAGDGRVSLTGAANLDLAFVVPEEDLTWLVAATTEAGPVTLRAGLPVEPLRRGRVRWEVAGTRGVARAPVSRIAIAEVGEAVAPTAWVDGAIRARPSRWARTLSEAPRVGVDTLEARDGWVHVRVRHPLATVDGWAAADDVHVHAEVFEEFVCGTVPCASLPTPLSPGTAVRLSPDGAPVGRTLDGATAEYHGWPTDRVRLDLETPWGVLPLWVDAPSPSAADRWYTSLARPVRGAVATPGDPACTLWDASPEATAVRLDCATGSARRTLLRANPEWFVVLEGDAPKLCLQAIQRPAGPYGIARELVGLGAISGKISPRYEVLLRAPPGPPAEPVWEPLRVDLAGLLGGGARGEAFARVRGYGSIAEGFERFVVQNGAVESLLGPHPLPLVEALDAEEEALVARYGAIRRRVVLAFEGPGSASVYVGAGNVAADPSEDVVRCRTFNLRKATEQTLADVVGEAEAGRIAPPGLDPRSFLYDPATDRVLLCLPSPGAVEVVPVAR